MFFPFLFSIWVSIPAALAQAITVASPVNDGYSISDFSIQYLYLPYGNPLELNNGTLQAPANSSGIFLNGPWNMEGGGVLTTGAVIDASWPYTNQSTDNHGEGNPYCGENSFDAAVLTMNVTLATNYSGLTSTLVYASK